ncbi:hypothetical protein [Archangium gephyra]|uniref:hypothetical protein n=1 Tax=Archangium gephyra TaxID=48 RepID=UPI0012E2807B|nr:hypothetical protein [Archangium gephyra]
MRRLVLLGLLGLGVNGCVVDPTDGTEQQEQPLCPHLVISDLSRSTGPALSVSTASSALSSTTAQPVLVRFRSQAGMRSAAALRQREDKLLRAGGRLKYHWPSLDAAALTLTPRPRPGSPRTPTSSPSPRTGPCARSASRPACPSPPWPPCPRRPLPPPSTPGPSA